MTSAFKEYVNIQNSLKRLSYKALLDVSKDYPWIQLELSLMFDGRFYGAEIIDGDYSIKDLEGILALYMPKDKYIDPVKEIRQLRDMDYYDD